MRQRDFGQYCGLARALDVVGERWALLIVGDLLVRPRRYGELHKGLPAIPTNVLASRLKELEAAGGVERQLLPAAARGGGSRRRPSGGSPTRSPSAASSWSPPYCSWPAGAPASWATRARVRS